MLKVLGFQLLELLESTSPLNVLLFIFVSVHPLHRGVPAAPPAATVVAPVLPAGATRLGASPAAAHAPLSAPAWHSPPATAAAVAATPGAVSTPPPVRGRGVLTPAGLASTAAAPASTDGSHAHQAPQPPPPEAGHAVQL